MFLRCSKRGKDGKEHLYGSVVENRRRPDQRVLRRHALCLGELNGVQESPWRKTVELLARTRTRRARSRCFPRNLPRRMWVPKSFPSGACAFRKWPCAVPARGVLAAGAANCGNNSDPASFGATNSPPGRGGTRGDQVLQTPGLYRLIDPGSAGRRHRHWFAHTALADRLGGDFARAQIHRLCECHDPPVAHKAALFEHLTARRRDLFAAPFGVLLYDLTSTYFESDPPVDPAGPRRFGSSRDKRGDCVQVVIALIVTPEGFPLASEMLPGHHRQDRAQRLPRPDPKAVRQGPAHPGHGPRHPHRGNARTKARATRPCATSAARRKANAPPSKPLPPRAPGNKRGPACASNFSRKQAKPTFWSKARTASPRNAPCAVAGGTPTWIGAPKSKPANARRAARFVHMDVPWHGTGKTQQAALSWKLDRKTLRTAWRRAGRDLLRTNLTETDPAKLWEFYLQLTEVEPAFQELKGDPVLRPIPHQLASRIEAHLCVSFPCCLQVTLKARRRRTASGLTPRAVLEKFAAVQMIDVHRPTTDGREIVMARHTQPEKDLPLLLDQLQIELPEQGPPKIQALQ